MGSIKQALRGVKVHCHKVAPIKKHRKYRKNIQKPLVHVHHHSRFINITSRRKKTFIVPKNRRKISLKRNILKSNNMRRIIYRGKKTKQSLKNITAAEAIMLYNKEI